MSRPEPAQVQGRTAIYRGQGQILLVTGGKRDLLLDSKAVRSILMELAVREPSLVREWAGSALRETAP